SKTIEETHAIWGETETLRRVVRKIREIRPHVIITHHGREKDHGHHQAIGKAVIDGFDLAGDATAFPEQFAEGLETWRPSRLYIRAWTPGPDSVTLDLAKLESLRGMTYAEITAKALEAHASQGMSFFIERYLSGRPKAHYDLVRQVRDAATGNEDVAGPLFAGLPAGVHPAHRRLAESRASRPEALDALLPLVASDSDETFAKKAARAAVCAAELRIEAHAEDPVVIPGQAVRIQADLRDFGRHDATSVTFACAWGGAEEIPDPFTVSVQEGAAAWECMLSTPRDMGTGEAEARVVAHVMCAGGAVPMESTVRVEVAPATRIEFAGAPYLARKDGDRVVRCDLLCTNHASAAREDVVRIEAPEGWSADVAEHPLRFDHEDQQWAFTVTLRLPESVAEGVYEVRARARDGVDAVAARVSVVDVALPKTRGIGLIENRGTGVSPVSQHGQDAHATPDVTLRATLERLGLPYTLITRRDFHPETLDRYDTIIVDMRAYQYRPDLIANNNAVLEYVRRGGALIVMYQKTFEWRPTFSPYPIHVSRNRVTREDAPITHLAPEHPLFHAPNAIRPDDWDGWVHERGLYFPDRWDAAYTPLIACSDPEEDIPPGSCLVARHGDGLYVYTALAWYRQLRELHPGALCLFANLLALR
ncbi:MAG TPA: hypothetical protein PKL84_07455, partial [Candidatus Hydrogenedentes bacterium]|nr:hypothetical protein [Candidatus Hydrogenedentota bacterium]